MTLHDDLLRLERDAWRALSTSGDAAAQHYGSVLADEVLMMLPGGLMIDDRQSVIDSMRGEPWDEYHLTDERVIRLDDDAAVVAYRAAARRGDHDYEALFNSTYARHEGTWRMVVHQQTPL